LTPYTRDWWTDQYEDKGKQNLVAQDASSCIRYILELAGKWSHGLKLLDVQCGLGAMVHLLGDAGFREARGIDSDPAVSAYWSDEGAFAIQDPTDMPFNDLEWGLVSWFRGKALRDEEIEEEILKEISRVTSYMFVYRPSMVFTAQEQEQVISKALNAGFILDEFNPVLNIYLFQKG